MKKLVLLGLLLAMTKVYGQENQINIIPQPVEIKQSNGSLKLTASTSVSYDSPESKGIADMFIQKINTASGFSIRAQQGDDATIKFLLNKKPVPALGDEGYSLDVNSNGVSVTANKPAGIFYGMQTLLQLMPVHIESKKAVNAEWNIPYVNITDYPRFKWRGMMLDVSRHFFSKEDVKAYIDEISRFKYNTFHWHLTDDNGWRIEIKSLPRLTSIGAWRVPREGTFGKRSAPKPGEKATYGGFYTQDDIKEVVRYAQDRFVTIVPEIDIPGHSMAAIAAYPELSATKDTSTKVNPGSSYSEWYGNGTFKMLIDNTLNPSDEKVYQFLDKVFTEVAALFPNPYIHAGGDECYKGFWEKDPGCQALMKKMNMKNAEELQSYFMKRVEQILKTKGKKLIGWDEILEGGLAPEATVMSWRGIKGGIEAAKMGHDVVMSPTDFAYLDYQQGESTIEPPIYASLRLSKCYSFNPVPEGVDAKYILGGQGNLWTEQIPTLHHAEYMIWPRALALSEDYWSRDESKNWDNFIRRVENQMPRFEMAAINYSTAIYDPIINTTMNGKRMVLDMQSEAPDIDIFYSLDGTMPGIYSPRYTKPVDIPEGPVTLRVQTYKAGKPIGHLITLKPEDLKKR
jgi:hexosaminidase